MKFLGKEHLFVGTFEVATLNILRSRRNEQHFSDDIFKRICFNETVWISIKFSLKFVPKGLINNIPALVRIMAWRRSGDKPLRELMVVRLLTQICVAQPQWVVIDVIIFRISKRCWDDENELPVFARLLWQNWHEPTFTPDNFYANIMANSVTTHN